MKRERRFIRQASRMTFTQIIGAVMTFAGVLILVFTVVYGFFVDRPPAQESTVVAIGFFLIMLGLAFLFPEMLEGPGQSVSSMRVTVYMVVSVFVFLAVKIGWATGSFAEFQLDSTWAYILAIALGSKAVQSLGENNWLGKRKSPGSEVTPNPGLGSDDDDDDIITQNQPVRSSQVRTPPSNLRKKPGA
ncbi:MAG: hypothetical protein EOO05_02400 [Chitinophagaceae bacterium]|nr:MAG: hypothetical protein EOO05_02400 [Chitinophagaceae bacterium]